MAEQFVVRILDGLGNQLFQYALGRKLSSRYGSEPIFDTSWYELGRNNAQRRPLALMDFGVRGEFGCSDSWQNYWVRPGRAGRLWWHVEQRYLPPHFRRFVQQRPEDFVVTRRMFDPRVLRCRPGTYLFGWWISPRYFEGIEDQLRDDLVLRAEPTNQAAHFRELVQRCESVALHIRRGDYLNHSTIGILGASYYERAIRVIRSKVGNPKFFIFSDDNTAAHELLRGILDEYEFVQLESDASPAMDLWVMAGCSHFINANSTFSWWGAWLSTNKNKTIIVPRAWFAGAGIEVVDVYPLDWLRIPNN